MSEENSQEIYQYSGLKTKTSEPATEMAEQSMVSGIARVQAIQPDFASSSENVISDVNAIAETELKGPASELEYQNGNVKNMKRLSVNGLTMDYAPGFKSFGGNMEANDEQRMSRRPYISSAGYHICIVSDGVETVHFYPRNSDSESVDYRPRQHASNSSKSNGFSSMSQNGASASDNFSSNSRMRSYQVPSSFGKSSYHSQHVRQLPKEGHPDMRPSPARNIHQYGDVSYKPRDNYEFTLLHSYTEASKEVICGPRALGRGDFMKTNEMEDDLPYFSRRRNFNLPDFQTDYENAKFYIIKSFGEDNVHKSVKYGAWSSTRYGNEKLDAAYSEAKAKGIETGKKCPVFLFFSVNRSGQFVGVAEMIGRVDFNKDLDFWQLDNWSGFFPVKWHILKDIPHSELQHIILKESDNRSVTFTRDTQEIGLCQGIEMLKIFKEYSGKTSLLDDFSFYVNREKLRVAERKSKSERRQSEEYVSDSCRDEDVAGNGRSYNNRAHVDTASGYGRSYDTRAHVDMASVIRRTRDLSLNSFSN